MKRGALFAMGGLLLAACAGNGPVRTVGTAAYPPLPPSVEVAVFTAADQIDQPYEVIGPISYRDPSKYEMLAASNAIEPLKARARAVGGNAIVIDKTEPVKSGVVTVAIAVEGRALRLTGKSR
jgi:hypothetical protein